MASPNPALEQFIRTIPLFSLVESAELNDVLRLLRPVQIDAGEVLFREGDPGKAMWVLGEGCEVSVAAQNQPGRRPVAVAYARAGDVLGEMALVDDGPRSATAVVTQGGHAHQIDAQEFHAMRGNFTPAAFKVLRKICIDLCARLRATNERIIPSGHSHIETPPRPPGARPDAAMLERFPSFNGLPAVVKLALAQTLQVYDFEEITPVFAEGEAGDGTYFIVEGEVSVGRNGKTLANLPAGSMFGQVACIDRGARSASCVTTGPAKLLKMTSRDFDKLFASGHRFAYQMIDLVARQLVVHVREANQMIPLPGKASGPAKTARVPKSTPSQIARAAQAPAATAQAEEEAIELELEMDTALPIELELDLGEPPRA